MRILYLCADRGISLEKSNGATAHFRSLVRAFTTLGHEVLVLTPSQAREAALVAAVARIPAPPQLQQLLDDVEHPVSRGEREVQRKNKRIVHALGHVWNNVAVEQTLEEHIRRFEPAFVFELYSPYGIAGTLVCNRLKVPHVLNVHAPLAWEGATFRSQALQEAAEFLETSTFHHARRIVANSLQMRDLLAGAGVDPGKIEVVINGVDLDLFSPAGDRRRLVDENSVVFGFSGSLKAWHGVDVLCRAFRKAAEADSRFHLLVVGDGPMRKEVDRLAASLPGRVTFTGALPLEDVPAWIRGMDVAVAPYPPLEHFYFSPLKILDAMACGVPNIASAIGQVPELLRENETGLLVPPGDPDALASAMRRAADDAGLRRRLGQSGLLEARQRHAWTLRADEIVRVATNTVSGVAR